MVQEFVNILFCTLRFTYANLTSVWSIELKSLVSGAKVGLVKQTHNAFAFLTKGLRY
jgi:hypothetical protein